MANTVKAEKPAPLFTSRSKRKVKDAFASPFASAIAIVIAVLWSIPTFGLLVSSFRPAEQINTTGWWTALTNPEFTLDNYTSVLIEGTTSVPPLWYYFFNSFAITLPAAIFPLTLATFAAYALAWFDFKGRDFLFFGIFTLQVIPLQMSLIPLLQLFAKGLTIGDVTIIPDLGITGTYIPIWIAHTIFALPLATFLLHNFLRQIPRELIEAARVDGAGWFTLFRRVVFPLSIPAIASFAIFQFLWGWIDIRWWLTGHFAANCPLGRDGRNPRFWTRSAYGRSVRFNDRSTNRVLCTSALLRTRLVGRFSQGLAAS